MSFEIGKTYSGYEFLDIVKRSKTEITYRVRNVLARRIEALRVLPRNVQEDQQQVERFLREMQVHARLVHPNIVTFYSAMEVERQLVMTTELVEGPTLADRLDDGAIAWQDALTIAAQTLDALEYAHGQRIIHRDITPEHIILTPGGNVKLSGFGLARAETSPQLTEHGAVLGNLRYISPERIKGKGELDPRSDLYSLGAVLYHALAGRPPFVIENHFELMLAHVSEAAQPPGKYNPALPQALDEPVLKALAKEPADRYESAAAFRSCLESVRSELEHPKPVVAAVPAPADSDLTATPSEAAAPAVAAAATAPTEAVAVVEESVRSAATPGPAAEGEIIAVAATEAAAAVAPDATEMAVVAAAETAPAASTAEMVPSAPAESEGTGAPPSEKAAAGEPTPAPEATEVVVVVAVETAPVTPAEEMVPFAPAAEPEVTLLAATEAAAAVAEPATAPGATQVAAVVVTETALVAPTAEMVPSAPAECEGTGVPPSENAAAGEAATAHAATEVAAVVVAETAPVAPAAEPEVIAVAETPAVPSVAEEALAKEATGMAAAVALVAAADAVAAVAEPVPAPEITEVAATVAGGTLPEVPAVAPTAAAALGTEAAPASAPRAETAPAAEVVVLEAAAEGISQPAFAAEAAGGPSAPAVKMPPASEIAAAVAVEAAPAAMAAVAGVNGHGGVAVPAVVSAAPFVPVQAPAPRDFVAPDTHPTNGTAWPGDGGVPEPRSAEPAPLFGVPAFAREESAEGIDARHMMIIAATVFVILALLLLVHSLSR